MMNVAATWCQSLKNKTANSFSFFLSLPYTLPQLPSSPVDGVIRDRSGREGGTRMASGIGDVPSRLVSISMGLVAFNSAGHLSNHSEVAPNHAGLTFAVSNTLATIPGLLCGPLTAGLVTASHGRWFPVFALAAGINLTGAMIYSSQSSATQVLAVPVEVEGESLTAEDLAAFLRLTLAPLESVPQLGTGGRGFPPPWLIRETAERNRKSRSRGGGRREFNSGGFGGVSAFDFGSSGICPSIGHWRSGFSSTVVDSGDRRTKQKAQRPKLTSPNVDRFEDFLFVFLFSLQAARVECTYYNDSCIHINLS
ncbi:unnamed protein product [Cyprideis torosa]|uniref:Uncharacterized protein n=1 Tax=Cyprideis torosa TaxID=163714 RepID=A0A7R8WI67_9CRUS|nr:unnamed protein product [Cyprideis torosa]CAG0893757.1 unnamed protein product [Cyprideis torosa]